MSMWDFERWLEQVDPRRLVPCKGTKRGRKRNMKTLPTTYQSLIFAKIFNNSFFLKFGRVWCVCVCVCVYRSMQHPCMSSWTLTLPELWMKAIGLSTECLSASSQGAPISLSAHSLVLCYLSLVTSSPSLVPWLASPLSQASSTTCTSRFFFPPRSPQSDPIISSLLFFLFLAQKPYGWKAHCKELLLDVTAYCVSRSCIFCILTMSILRKIFIAFS